MKHLLSLLAVYMLPLAIFASGSVKWLSTKHNFGAFNEDDGPVNCSFYFVNNTTEPVSILSARASCGCTTPEYPRSAIAIGDTASITVTYDPAARPGRFSKTITIRMSNDEKYRLEISGTVVGSEKSVSLRFPKSCVNGLQLSKGVVSVGEITKGKRHTTYLDGYNRSTETIYPVAENLPKYFTAVVSPDTVPPGQQFSFIFYMNSDKCEEYGVVNDSVVIRTHRGAADGCVIPTVAVVKEDFSRLTAKQLDKAPRITLDAKSLDFGRLGTGVATRTGIIRNVGKSALKIRRVYTAVPGVEVAVSSESIKPGKSAEVTVMVDTTKLPGALLNAHITIITNDPVTPEFTLRAVGEL